MIEVIFVVHARGKVSTRGGSLETLPQRGQMIRIKGTDHKVLSVMETVFGSMNRLPKPEIEVEPMA